MASSDDQLKVNFEASDETDRAKILSENLSLKEKLSVATVLVTSLLARRNGTIFIGKDEARENWDKKFTYSMRDDGIEVRLVE